MPRTAGRLPRPGMRCAERRVPRVADGFEQAGAKQAPIAATRRATARERRPATGRAVEAMT